ncbi:hypothetical protein [Streptomyces fagopyri]|uniref:hypothetical protein n=1 Tax=Streptomyces fagopyri TaxID=2662397 RepID=UPI0033D8185A
MTKTCRPGGSPGITFWLRNHAAHPMAYDIRYEFLDENGRVVGSTEGVFTLSAHQLIGDETLWGDTGRCGPRMRLAYINAYDSSGDGADQPTF